MKISKKMLILLSPLALLAEEGVNEIEAISPSPQTILVSEVEYNEEVKFNKLNNNFDIEIVNERQEEPSTETILPIELSPIPPETNINNPIITEEKIIEVEHKASILTPLSYEEAVTKAQAEHKTILLEVVATDCKYCEKMEEQVLTQPQVIEMIKNNFILLKINGTIETLPLGMGMVAAPMHVFISEDEQVKEKYYGYKDMSKFLNILKKEQ